VRGTTIQDVATQPLGPVTEARFAVAFADRAIIDKATAAGLLGMDVKTLDAMTTEGLVRAVTRGAHRAYTERDLRLYLLAGPDIR
jgi:hypothetical protein